MDKTMNIEIDLQDLQYLLPSIQGLKMELENHGVDDDYKAILLEVVEDHSYEINKSHLLLPFYQSEIKKQVIQHIRTLKTFEKQFALLTPKEEEVLSKLAEGKSRKQIAEDLTCSPSTIKKHCEHIYKKIGTNDRLVLNNIVKAYLEA